MFTSLLKSLGMFMTLQIKTSFESANVLIIFILPTMERSLWNHIFNVFFKDPNFSKKFFFSDTSISYVKRTQARKLARRSFGDQEWYLFCGA